MSATAAYIQDLLYIRSQYAKAGLKKRVKSSLSRAQRSAAKREVARETTLALMDNLAGLSSDELELCADAFLQASHLDDAQPERDTDEVLERSAFLSEAPNIPYTLQGSLPDWMLEQMEAANGSAFELLSLFESKRVSPQAAYPTEDEALFG